jgi:putative NADPH-quinone reductase
MRDILIIFVHPDTSESVNACILRQVMRGLCDAGLTCTVIDLYGEGFNPVFSKQELREGLLSAEVQRHHELILSHKKLLFICPAWNYGIPAMLKGWIDRVLCIPGFSFVEDEKHRYRGGLLRHEEAVIIQTFGGRFDLADEVDIAALSYYTGGVKSIVEYCGIKKFRVKQFFGLYNAEDTPEKIVTIEEESYQLALHL